MRKSYVLQQRAKFQLLPRILFARQLHYVAAIVPQLHYAICITLFEGRYTRFIKHRLTKLAGIYNWYINLLLSAKYGSQVVKRMARYENKLPSALPGKSLSRLALYVCQNVFAFFTIDIELNSLKG